MYVSALSKNRTRLMGMALLSGWLCVPAVHAGHHDHAKQASPSDEQHNIEVAYIGLVARPLPPSVAAHLDLPDGIGLLVEYVDPKGAVADSIKTHDVLHKLNDQLLINQQQFSTLVRSMDIGTTVDLHILRKGKPHTVSVTLSGRDIPKRVHDSWRDMQNHWRGLQDQLHERYEEWKPRMRERIEQPLQDQVKTREKDMQTLIDEVTRRISKLKLEPGTLSELMDQVTSAVSNTYGHIEIQVDGADPGAEISTSVHSGNSAVMTLMDGAYRITVRGKDGDKNLKAFDHNGELIFEGPINTDNERAEVPAEVHELLERLENAHEHLRPSKEGAAEQLESDNQDSVDQPIY